MITGERYSTKYYERYYDKKICFFCKKPFYVRKKISKKRLAPHPVRSHNAITCSKKCSELNKQRHIKLSNDRHQMKVVEERKKIRLIQMKGGEERKE